MADKGGAEQPQEAPSTSAAAMEEGMTAQELEERRWD